jgi:hypothetical protein
VKNFGKAASWAGDPGGPLSTNAFRWSALRFIKGAIALHSFRSAAVVSDAAEVDGEVTEDAWLVVDVLAAGRSSATIATTRAATASNIADASPTV